jgi:hypothetical protein
MENGELLTHALDRLEASVSSLSEQVTGLSAEAGLQTCPESNSPHFVGGTKKGSFLGEQWSLHGPT